MPFTTWDQAVKAIEAATQAATPEQLAVASRAGIAIPAKTPGVVAAAMLRVGLYKELHLPPESPVSNYFGSRLDALRPETELTVEPKNSEEAEAWVSYLRLLRRARLLAEYRLETGDVVELADGEKAEVSSIDGDGRVFFKGGRGYRAWPDLIVSVLARKGDSAEEARKVRVEAENSAARRASSPEWSVARSDDLVEFVVTTLPTEDKIDELESVIAGAEDEKPVQLFLQRHPHLLTALLGGKERFCIPQKRLGAEYVPDFVMGDVDSLGVRWILVELETPQSGIYLTDAKTLDQYARKGIDQIFDWQNWIGENIAYAQKPRLKEGLGLADISNQSEALVLVGRRARIPSTKNAKRLALQRSNNIRVHSYDWLLEKLRGAITHSGPPATNPFLISRSDLDDRLSSRPR